MSVFLYPGVIMYIYTQEGIIFKLMSGGFALIVSVSPHIRANE